LNTDYTKITGSQKFYYSGCPFLLNFILTFPPGVERQKGLMEKRKVLGP